MRIKHVEVFNAIMLTGTVSGAARLLHVTQPAVTQTLQHAELQLGYALFTRQRNRLVPTREAQALYPEVQRLVSQLESVRRLAGALRGGQQAVLRILVVPSLAVHALPQALALFRQRHPAVPVAIRTLHSPEIAQAIALQEGDVGIVFGHSPHPAVQQVPVAQGRMVCVSPVPSTRGGDRRSTVELAEVLRSAFIRIDERDPIGAMLAEQCAREGLAPEGGITVQTHHIAMTLAAQGFGPALIDSFTAAAADDTLQVRTLVPEVPVSISALLPQGERSPQPAGDLIDAFRRVVSPAA
jgi:DNA-binding transcriptional LysR family regulator